MIKKYNFGNISDINVGNELAEGDLFLTFDIDWAHDDVIRDCMVLVERYDASATFFMTHQTAMIKELRENKKIELGIHPNFNKILNGTENGTSAEQILKSLKRIVPEATSVRSHSTTFSSQLCALFAKYDLTHDSNYFIPDYSEIELKPWKNWLGVTMVPYLWEDDVACVDCSVGAISQLVQRKGLRVFDFHPIHVFLNTESLSRYENTREYHRNPEELIKHRYKGYGTRNRLIELLELVNQ